MKKNQATISEHFTELRRRVFFSVIFFFITFICCYFFSQEIYQFLLKPFAEILPNDNSHRLIYTNPSEAFITYIKLSFYLAILISLPIFILEFYLFLSPALYENEKKNLLLIIFFTPAFFFFGVIFSYYFALPLALKFFISFETQGFANLQNFPIQLETKISEYLNFIFSLFFAFGLTFLSPIFLLFLIKIGFLSIDDLKKKRRFWIVIIFIISAILTPPDVLSQITLSILMILFFEIVILIGKNFNNKK